MERKMYYFYFRTGPYDCVRISNLNTPLQADTICAYVGNCGCYCSNRNTNTQFNF